MEKIFKSGYVRKIDYDSKECVLEITFENLNCLAYKGVPNWVFEKLSRDPSPKSFWEDHIKDEYTPTSPKKKSSLSNLEALNNLFGNS
jgi:hypothetical protein